MLTDALILKTWPYSESTLIVQMLTRDAGAVRAIAKGARRLKGQTAAAFDLCAWIRANVRVRSGEGLSMLVAVELKNGWGYLRHDLKRLALASLGLEILGAVAGHSPPESFFFEEGREFLELLEGAEAPGSLTALLLIRLLHHAGYPPRLETGLKDASIPERMTYDFAEGTFRERLADGDAGNRAFSMPGRLVERLIPLFTRVPRLEAPFKTGADDGAMLLRWLIRVWEDHLDQKFPSGEFLEKTVLRA